MNVDNNGTAAELKLGKLDFGKVENVDLNISDLASDKDFTLDLSGAIESFNFTSDGGKIVNLGTIGTNNSLKAAAITTDATTVTGTINQAGGGLMTLHGKGDYNLTFTGTNGAMAIDASDLSGKIVLTATEKDAAVQGSEKNDTINLGYDDGTNGYDELTQTVKFGASLAENGEDTIKNFKANNLAGNGDKLDFTAFLGTKVTVINDGGAAVTGASATALADCTTGAAAGTNVDATVFYSAAATQAALEALIIDGDATGAALATALYLKEGGHAVVLNSAATTGVNDIDIYYVTHTGDDIVWEQVGTLGAITTAAAGLASDEFVGA